MQRILEASYFLIAVRQPKIPVHACNTVHHLSPAYQLMGYILVLRTRALRSALKLQQPAERCVSRSIGESVNRVKRGRRGACLSHNSHVAVAPQVRRRFWNAARDAGAFSSCRLWWHGCD